MLKTLQQNFLEALHNESQEIFSEKHIAIYRNSILGAKQSALKNIFPVCYKLVGEDFFVFMANEYIKKYPSHSPDLNHYGEHFPQFIKSFDAASSLPYLSDVAQLEWAWDKIDRMSSFISSPYPIHQIWETNQEDYTGDTLIILEENKIYHYRISLDQTDTVTPRKIILEFFR